MTAPPILREPRWRPSLILYCPMCGVKVYTGEPLRQTVPPSGRAGTHPDLCHPGSQEWECPNPDCGSPLDTQPPDADLAECEQGRYPAVTIIGMTPE